MPQPRFLIFENADTRKSIYAIIITKPRPFYNLSPSFRGLQFIKRNKRRGFTTLPQKFHTLPSVECLKIIANRLQWCYTLIMTDLKEIIAANLTRLRQQAGLTQLQLADMLNYSDKAVSKWERGESIPDLRVLIQLAEIYHITVDDIVKEQPEKAVKPKLHLEKKHILITLLSVGLVWVVATGIFMILYYISSVRSLAYLTFVVAPFVSAVVLVVFSSVWGRRITTTLAASAVIWSIALIVHVFLALFTEDVPIWPFYIVAAGVQILVIGWFVLRKLYKPNRKNKN